MEIFWTRFIQKKKKETVVSAVLLLIALSIYFLSTTLFKQKIDQGAVALLLFFVVALLTRFGLIIYRVNKGFYGNNEEECREVIKELLDNKTVSAKEAEINWWVDICNLRIEPVVMIPPMPSFWQRFTNLFRDYLLRHNKYVFQCVNRDGSLGKKITGNNVYADIADATLYLKRVKGENVVYKYKYSRNPFDGPQYFSVVANSQEEANKKATEKFSEMFEKGHTVTTEFYPVIEKEVTKC